jgi:hypothetical protein
MRCRVYWQKFNDVSEEPTTCVCIFEGEIRVAGIAVEKPLRVPD